MSSSPVKHLAIIMDGNGRWAQTRGLSRSQGHEAGAVTVRTVTQWCSEQGITHLTLYTFSTENWKRPKIEVDFLTRLLARYLKNELPLMMRHNIRFATIGDLSRFSSGVRSQIAATCQATAGNTGLTQILAINYGGRDEIVRACSRLAARGEHITEEAIGGALDTAAFPPLDMMIRTGGDMRISNFLLWQAAYAELFFTPTLWPDFSPEELAMMIETFRGRQRRYGGLL